MKRVIYYDYINKDDIKKILLKKYGESTDRELVELTKSNNGYSKCIFYYLNGTPPKGYTIYIPDFKTLIFYDKYGKAFKEFEGVHGIGERLNTEDISKLKL